MGRIYPGECDYETLGRKVAGGINIPSSLDPDGRVKRFLDNHIQRIVTELTGKAWKLSKGSVLECTWSQDLVFWDGQGVTEVSPEVAHAMLKQALLEAGSEPRPQLKQDGGGQDKEITGWLQGL